MSAFKSQFTHPDPVDVDWPRLLAVAAVLGVRVWRPDRLGQLVEVTGAGERRTQQHAAR